MKRGESVPSKKTLRAFCAEYQFSLSSNGIHNDFLAVLTAYLGFSVSSSNLLLTVGGMMALLQMCGTAVMLKVKNRTRLLRTGCCTWRVLQPFVYLSILLPGKAGMLTMLLCYLLMTASYQFCQPSYTEWVIDAVGDRSDNTFFMTRSTIWLITYTLLSLAAGFAADRLQEAGETARALLMIGILLAVLQAVGLWMFSRCPMNLEQSTGQKRQNLRDAAVQVIKNRPYLSVLAVYLMMTVSGPFFGSFAALYRIQVLNMRLFDITFWSMVGYGLRIVLSPLAEKLAKHIGWSRVTAATFLIMGITAVGWIAVNEKNSVWLLPLLSVIQVMPHTVYEVGFLKMEIMTTQEGSRSVYFSVKALAGAVASGIAGLFCTALIGFLERTDPASLNRVFIIGAVGQFLCMLLCFRVFRIEKKNMAYSS